MATFSYKTTADRGRGAMGGSATIDAPDRAAAVRELLRRGVTPTALEQVSAMEVSASGGAPALRSGVWGAAMSRSEMAAFIRELATALQAGLPLVQALKTIAKQGRSQRQKDMLSHVIEQVEHGRSLADAASSWGKPFTDLTVNLMRSGEAAGRLPEVLAGRGPA